MRCSRYTVMAVSTAPRNSTTNASSSLPGHQHWYPHHTTPAPAKHCHLHHAPCTPPMYSVPSTMLRGRGWRSGGLDLLCSTTVLYLPQYRVAVCVGRARPKSHISHLIPRQPLVSQLGRDGSPTRVVNRFWSSRWQYRDRALDHTTFGGRLHVLVLRYALALTLAPCDRGPGRAWHTPPCPCQLPDARWQTQETHAGRVLPWVGNSMLWHWRPDMGCVQIGIVIVLPAAAAANRAHTGSGQR